MSAPLTKPRRPAWLPVVAMLLTLPVLLWLGLWQLDRAGQKQALFDRFGAAIEPVTMAELASQTPEALRYRQIVLKGQYVADRQFLSEGLSHEGRPGLQVLTPFRLSNDRLVVVNRGWIPETRTRTTYPDLSIGQGIVEITGRVVPFPKPGLRLESAASTDWPRRLVYPTAQDIATALNSDEVYPQMIWLDASAADGFVRAWKPSEFGPARHIGYAVQWFALAVTLVLIYIVLRFRRHR